MVLVGQADVLKSHLSVRAIGLQSCLFDLFVKADRLGGKVSSININFNVVPTFIIRQTCKLKSLAKQSIPLSLTSQMYATNER